MSRGVAYDVTEARQAESQALALMREHAAMLDNDLIGVVKLKGRQAMWVNKAMCRIFGYSEAELLGQSSQMLYSDEAAFLALGEAAYGALRRGETYRAQVAMAHKDGRPLWIDLSGVRLPEAKESMWMLADITAIHDQQRQVEHLAFHDALTGLPNRLLLADRLDRALVLAKREGGRVAVCFLDLDRFKPVNDKHGHAAGDALLKAVAERLRACVRAHDTLARMGGDEFVLVLTHLQEDTDFVPILDRVVLDMRRCFELEAGVTALVSASIGVAVFPDDAQDRAKLLRRADEALYDAKARGRSQFVRIGR
jgi:diguanylate cyclase (GGDEF)-like protein/PAS domain S-box-containing protein